MITNHQNRRPGTRSRRLVAAGAIAVAATGAGMTVVAAAPVEIRNAVEAVNLEHDGDVHHRKWLLAELDGETETSNLAVAVSSCERCRTSAAAVEVVLVSHAEGAPALHNHAEAVNSACSTCETSASAHQLVVLSPGSIWLSSAGHERLRELRSRLEHLEPPPTADATLAAVGALAGEVRAVLGQEVRSDVPLTEPPAGDPSSVAASAVPFTVHHFHEEVRGASAPS